MRVDPSRGVVAAGDQQTAEAGARALACGGNAIDAAIAAAFAAFVCELPLASPLGGGVMLLERTNGDVLALDLFARTPGLGAGPSPDVEFVDVEVDFGATTQVFHVGRGSAAVPLALPGLLEAHQRWGKLPLSEVLAPAIELGRKGYCLGAGVAFVVQVLTPIVQRSVACQQLFSAGNRIARAGDQLNNPQMAATFDAIARRPEVVREIYSELAEQFGATRGGLMTVEDVVELQPRLLTPICLEHRGWKVRTMPAPSTGGLLVALGLRLSLGLGKMPFLSQAHLARILRIQELLHDVRSVDFDRRCHEAGFADSLLTDASVGALRSRLDALSGSNPLGSTTHISALDADGGGVALTLTNGEGCGHVLSGTGMVVNNLLGEEDIHPRGFHRDPPGEPLATMMSPTLVHRDRERLALGSGGSNRLRNAILQVLTHRLEHAVSLEQAVLAPRLHLERIGGVPRLTLEALDLETDVVDGLLATYPDRPSRFPDRNLYFGGVHVAHADGQHFAGFGDPRRGGAAVVA